MLPTQTSTKSFGKLFLKRQWRLFGIMFHGLKSTSTMMFIVLVILSLLYQVVVYEAGLVPSMYFEVLGAKDYDQFKSVAVYSIVIIVINALMKSSLTYLSRLLYVKWREMVCRFIHERYFCQNEYYKLNVLDPQLDNIDQRIVRDVNFMCEEFSTLMSRLVVIPVTIVYYSYQCFVSTTYLGPIIIYIYFICGTIINKFIMSPVVRITVQREKCEGDFRFQHLQVRVNAESMAFYNAEEIEKYKSNQRLNVLLQIQKSLYGWAFWLNSSVNIFDYLGGILSYLIIAIPIFNGEYDDLAPEELSAVISRNSFVCMYLIHSFSQLFDMARIISDIAGHTHRLGELLEEFQRIEDKDPTTNDEEVSSSLGHKEERESYQILYNEEYEGDDKEVEDSVSDLADKHDVCYELKDVSYQTPDGDSELLRRLNLVISNGNSVLVTGNTGVGKTSLFRILCGLWEPLDGTVDRFYHHGQDGVMFLPQKPLCTDGTLKQLVVYPSLDGYKDYSISTDDARIIGILDKVGLTDLYSRMGGISEIEEVNWADKLSPGEMQKLSFARLFYHNPKFAVMDEPTSALNIEMAEMLFGLCKEKDITCITAGHSDILLKYHDVQLHLEGEGSWRITSIL